jgi:hypothetical protein
VNKIALVQVTTSNKLETPVVLEMKHFGKLIYRGFIKRAPLKLSGGTAALSPYNSGGEGNYINNKAEPEFLVYITYTIHSLKEGRFDHCFNALQIPVNDVTQAT